MSLDDEDMTLICTATIDQLAQELQRRCTCIIGVIKVDETGANPFFYAIDHGDEIPIRLLSLDLCDFVRQYDEGLMEEYEDEDCDDD